MNKDEFQDDKFVELRKRAEEALNHSTLSEMTSASIEDVRRLLSELQVHQIELEMQNDELRQAQLQLAREREKYVDLYNFAPVAYFTVNQDDVIVDLNFAAAELLGHEPRYLTNRPITPFLTPDSLQIFIRHRDMARELRLPQTCELTIRRRDGSQAIVQAHTIVQENDAGCSLWRSVMIDITERKRAETQLQQQASWIGFISDAVIATDLNLVITNWNDAAEQIYGWTSAEALGQNIDALLKTEFLGITQAEAQAIFQRTGFWRGSIRQESKKGKDLYIEASVTLLKDSAGKVVGGITVNRDITERKQVEEALRASEEKFRSVIEQSSDGIILADEYGKIIEWNKSQEKISGLSRDEVIGRPAWEPQFRIALPEEQTPEKQEHLRRAVEAIFERRNLPALGQVLERKIRRPDGTFRMIETVSYPILGESHFWIGSVMRDITERKQADEALRQSEELFAKVFNASPSGIVISRVADGQFVDLNQEACNIYGYGREDLIGHTSLELGIITNETRRKLIESLQAKKAIHNYEIVVHSRNAGERALLCSMEIIEIKGEQCLLTTMIDITERKQAEEALRTSEERFRSLVYSLSDVVYTLDTDQRHTGVFGAWVEKAGMSPDFYLGKTARDLFGAEYAAVHEDANTQALAGESTSYEWSASSQTGTVYYQTIVSPLRDTRGNVTGLVGVGRDITERRQAEEALREREQRYRSLFKDNHAVMLLINPATKRIVDANQAACEYYGYSQAEITNLHVTNINMLSTDAISQEMRKAQTSQKNHFFFKHRLKNGEIRDVEVYSGSIHISGEDLLYSIIYDITERQKTEKIIQARLRITEFAAEHALDELLQNALDELCTLTDSPIGFFHFVEPDQRTLSLQAWSTRTRAEFCKAEGQGQHYSIDQAGVWVDCVREARPIIHNDYASIPNKRGLPEGHAPLKREMVFPILRSQKIVAIIGVGNKTDEYAESDLSYASRLADLIWDITARKQAEERIREALTEKELLLRELNHRTKNNLNIVNSLINLQANMSDNQEFKALAETLANRIQSISLVHMMLYQSPNLAHIDLANYARELAVNLMSGLIVSTGLITVEIDAEPVFVEINTAIPCGQILNELIVNAYKYAFPNGRQGKLTILIRQNNTTGEVTLCVKDDGIGLPPGFDINRLNSLGMIIVQTLISQLRGSLSIESQSGTSWVIRFVDKSGFPK